MIIKNNVNLGNKTTIWVWWIAKYYTEVYDENDLIEIYEFSKLNNIPIIPLWLWSNTFFYSDIKDKIIVAIKNKWIKYLWDSVFCIWAWEILHNVILKLSKDSFDLSALSWYPSTIWWWIVVNSWLLWNSIWDYLLSGKVFNLKTWKFEQWENKKFNFKYRSSKLKLNNNFIIFEANLKVPKWENIEEKVKNIINERIKKQPQWHSLWCFFKNPDFNYAWKIIDEAWLKWFRIWWAFVSEKHWNFLMTDKWATKENLFDLYEHIKKEIHDKHLIELEEEVVIY